LRDRCGNLGVRVAEADDRETAEEVEVLLALAVPETRALAAHERDRQPAVRLHHVLGVERLDLVESRHCVLPSSSFTTIVPIPSRVKNSSSNACGTRPSRMCARPTPFFSASTHDRTFGIMPSEIFPAASRRASPSASMRDTSEDSSG